MSHTTIHAYVRVKKHKLAEPRKHGRAAMRKHVAGGAPRRRGRGKRRVV